MEPDEVRENLPTFVLMFALCAATGSHEQACMVMRDELTKGLLQTPATDAPGIEDYKEAIEVALRCVDEHQRMYVDEKKGLF